jgi:flagellar hook protein FlgE
MQSINVKNLGAAVSKTTSGFVSANLNADQVASTGAATYVVGQMATYANNTVTPAPAMTKPDFTIDMSVVDSQGKTHKLVMAFLKPAPVAPATTSAPNTWQAELYAVPASDVNNGAANGLLRSGSVNFNQDGTINLTATGGSTLFGAAGTPAQIVLNASGGAANSWSTSEGVEAQTIDLDLTKLTQFGAASTVNAVGGNGATVGNVVGVQVNDEGIVSAIFDNSEVRQIAKIGIATFANPDGLQSVSGNAYRGTLASGDFVLKEAGVGGAGKISPSTLEASTVDLSAEFTGLITTQKAYSASSKIITTADQMLEELLNIKR